MFKSFALAELLLSLECLNREIMTEEPVLREGESFVNECMLRLASQETLARYSRPLQSPCRDLVDTGQLIICISVLRIRNDLFRIQPILLKHIINKLFIKNTFNLITQKIITNYMPFSVSYYNPTVHTGQNLQA